MPVRTEIPEPVKVLLTNVLSGDKAERLPSKVILICASRDIERPMIDFIKSYAPLELDITDHNAFKRLMARVQWKEQLDILIRLPRHLDFRSSAYYDLAQLMSKYIICGIRNLIVIGTWETARDAPKEPREFANIAIELHSWGYSIKVNE